MEVTELRSKVTPACLSMASSSLELLSSLELVSEAVCVRERERDFDLQS